MHELSPEVGLCVALSCGLKVPSKSSKRLLAVPSHAATKAVHARKAQLCNSATLVGLSLVCMDNFAYCWLLGHRKLFPRQLNLLAEIIHRFIKLLRLNIRQFRSKTLDF